MGIGHSARSVARRGRLRALDALTLAAVALVVLLVSLPRLQDLAVRENEADAAWLARRLAELCQQEPGTQDNVQALLADRPALSRLLDDSEFLEGGRMLRRHGYLFEVQAGAPGAQAPVRIVRAWPWQFERTGRAVFLWRSDGDLRGHANLAGVWAGVERPPPASFEGGDWRGVRSR
jgi:hypothetical protein